MAYPAPTAPDPATAGPVLLVERRGRVMVLTLNRPDARNSVDVALTFALGDALEEAEADRDMWAVVVTATGDRSFSAGADLKAVARGEKLIPDDPVRAAWGFAGYVSHPISKPTIAAVNGFALGGGTEIALASDLVVASQTASFGLPEVKRGLMAAAGGVFRLPTQVPRKVAMEMILTGEPVSAERALALGLVNRVVPQAEVLDAALALAEAICVNAPLSVQASKRVALGIVDGRTPDEDDAWRHNERETRVLMASSDAQEGPRAFGEKRAPVWQAR